MFSDKCIKWSLWLKQEQWDLKKQVYRKSYLSDRYLFLFQAFVQFLRNQELISLFSISSKCRPIHLRMFRYLDSWKIKKKKKVVHVTFIAIILWILNFRLRFQIKTLLMSLKYCLIFMMRNFADCPGCSFPENQKNRWWPIVELQNTQKHAIKVLKNSSLSLLN